MSSDEITLRFAEAADLDSLLTLAAAAPGAPQWTAHTWQQVFDSAATGEQRAVLLAESANELVGFGVVGYAAEQAEIESVAVSAAWRRRGVARLLCTEMLAWARAHGAREALLEVRISNAAARSLYASLGFRDAGIRRAYYHDPEEDAIVMTRAL
jgi:ribosomal-protein-alanine N-acetyltransferase